MAKGGSKVEPGDGRKDGDAKDDVGPVQQEAVVEAPEASDVPDALPDKERGTSKAGPGFPIVAVGASAGGFEAFQTLLENLPADTGMAFVLIQHLDPTHESHLAELLDRRTAMTVQEVSNGMKIRPNHVYVIPTDSHIYVADGTFQTESRKGVRGVPGAIDKFMESLASYAGSHAVGVILSGTLSDGTRGVSEIKAAGGFTFAQEISTAQYTDMPRNAIRNGQVDFVLPPDEIATQLAWLARQLSALQQNEKRQLDSSDLHTLHDLLRNVRKQAGIDFTEYKEGTVRRRINRRMIATRKESLEAYRLLVMNDVQEARALASEMLIHVTQFFRDREVFEALETNILPEMLKDQEADEVFRVWVPGCATGEEAYGIGMLLLEFQRKTGKSFPIQIFGTDISEKAIATARSAFYGPEIFNDVPELYQKRYFHQISGGYQVSKQVRSLCVFAEHDLLHDPPFSNMDLVSCRNVLIYMATEAQQRVLAGLHYAMKDNGRLLLGSSEAPGRSERLFSTVDKDIHIFKRRPGSRVHLDEFRAQRDYVYKPPSMVRGTTSSRPGDDVSVRQEIDRVMLDRFAPASVIVDEDLHVLYFRGDTSRYLRPQTGPADLNLMKMARPDLALEMREMVRTCLEERKSVERKVRFSHRDEIQEITIEAILVAGDGPRGRQVILAFRDRPDRTKQRTTTWSIWDLFRARSVRDLERRIEQLEHELASSREQLESSVEDYETTLEELRCANEEVLSSNEELQSTNEELQTANEEAQSTAEELRTLNEELLHRSQDVQKANNDLVNLLNSVNIPIVMLDQDLRLHRFTKQAEELLNLIPSDENRSLHEIRHPFKHLALDHEVEKVLESLQVNTLFVQSPEGDRYDLQIHPYKTLDGRIEGAVMMFMPPGPGHA